VSDSQYDGYVNRQGRQRGSTVNDYREENSRSLLEELVSRHAERRAETFGGFVLVQVTSLDGGLLVYFDKII